MRKSYLFLAAIFVMAGVYVFFILPVSARRQETKEQLAQQYAELKRYEGIIRGNGKAEARMKAAVEDLRRLEKGVLSAQSAPLGFSRLQIRLQDAAREAGLTVTSIRTLQPVEYEGYRGLPIHMDATCGIEGLSGFLRALDSGGMLLRIDKLDVAAAQQHRLRVKVQVTGLMKI